MTTATSPTSGYWSNAFKTIKQAAMKKLEQAPAGNVHMPQAQTSPAQASPAQYGAPSMRTAAAQPPAQQNQPKTFADYLEEAMQNG